ncbi:uncharacterized protein EI90DRAFT_3285819 [Cantharellus anzutake]|uniref:uncharacterized protein n=1 Tax=Cantharellus anzutake TaxID=1750568 RepID=UPI001908AF06|nr:uncharacterized protein EI90DRAFT_3285819 [Cantharellus anzutake]KAF8340417.1 hypothetical protein EI90DRAFT_3285819 [Cantharellus anzutake]
MASKCSNGKSFPLRAGILLISEIGLLSFTLATWLLIYSLRRAYRKRASGLDPGSKFGLQPISVLFLQGISNIMSVKWAFEGEVTEGSYCTAQAVMRQIGNDGVAWFTMAIAALTYLQLFHLNLLGERGAKIFAAASICFIAVFIILIVSIPASTLHPYYGNTGLWCWIVKRKENSRLRIASEDAWIWLAVLVAIAVYGLIAYRWRQDMSHNYDNPVMRRNAITMGWYPIVYFMVVAPQSAVRFLQFRANQPGYGWTVLTSAIFSSGGALNVILWLRTGRHFGWTSWTQGSRSPRDIELHLVQ